MSWLNNYSEEPNRSKFVAQRCNLCRREIPMVKDFSVNWTPCRNHDIYSVACQIAAHVLCSLQTRKQDSFFATHTKNPFLHCLSWSWTINSNYFCPLCQYSCIQGTGSSDCSLNVIEKVSPAYMPLQLLELFEAMKHKKHKSSIRTLMV